MAVTFTTKFYQESVWKDISKIVYTSPNMTSPNTVGTRSHILPGEGDLGLWYEDTSNMYRIETEQNTTDTSLYNYLVTTTTEIDTVTPSSMVTITGTTTTYDVFYGYMKDSVGCTAVSYNELNMSSVVTETRVKLEYSATGTVWDDKGHLPNVYETTVETADWGSDVYGITESYSTGDTWNRSWVVDQITDELECYIDIDLDKPYKITKIYMKGQYAYDDSASANLHRRFFGNYEIYGKLNLTDDWVLLYDGANTTSNDATLYLNSNDNFFQYYRILIQNNTGLTGSNVNTAYYALSALQFYEYNYNDIPTRTKPMYSFNENGDADIIYISDISEGTGTTYDLEIDSVTVSNSGTTTIATGSQLAGWGALTGTVDYQMDDSVVFEVTTGEAYNCRLTAWDDVTHSTVLNELIADDHVRCSALAFCCSNSKVDPNENYDPINYVWGPVQNRILKGNTVFGGQNLFYGDFDMVYRYQDDVYGDYLIFKPMLYGIDSSLSYGVKDFIMTLHYSYT